MNIEVSITRTPKPFVARIIKTAYGMELEWLALDRISSKYHRAAITEPGDYKVPCGDKGEAVCASMRRDTGYIRVSADGTVADISKQEAGL